MRYPPKIFLVFSSQWTPYLGTRFLQLSSSIFLVNVIIMVPRSSSRESNCSSGTSLFWQFFTVLRNSSELFTLLNYYEVRPLTWLSVVFLNLELHCKFYAEVMYRLLPAIILLFLKKGMTSLLWNGYVTSLKPTN